MAKKIKKPNPSTDTDLGVAQSNRLNTLATMSKLVGESEDQSLATMGRAMTKDAYLARALEEKRTLYPNNTSKSQLNKYEMDAIAKSFYDKYPASSDNTYESVLDASIYSPVSDSGTRQIVTPTGVVDSQAQYGDVQYGRNFGEFDTTKDKYLVGGLVESLTSGAAKLFGADAEVQAKAGAIGKTVGGAVESIYSPTGYADVAGGIGNIMSAYSNDEDVQTTGGMLGQGANLASLFMAMGGELPSTPDNQSNVTTEADTQFNGGELHTNGGLELTAKAEVEKGEFQHNFDGEKYIFSNNIKLI